MPLRNTILVDKEGNQLAPATIASQVQFGQGQNWEQYIDDQVDVRVGYVETDIAELEDAIDSLNLNIIHEKVTGNFSSGKCTIQDKSGYLLTAAYAYNRPDSAYSISNWSRQTDGSYVLSNQNATLTGVVSLQLIWVEEQNNVANAKPTIRTVKRDGTANYTSITAAVEAASNDDIIIVYPSVYNESVNALSKRVHIIGTSKTNCILTYSGLNYAYPPLEMAKGSVRNMTIIATNSGTEGSARAYCVHIDNNNSANEGLSFFNCDFINEVHQAIGIGLRANFTLEFVNCIFKANDAAALYCHDWETDDTGADKSGQKLVVRNCSLVNNSATHSTILLQSQEIAEASAEAVFIGNSVANNGGESLIYMHLWQGRTLTNNHFMGSSDWVLSDLSSMNSTDQINSILTVIPAYIEELREDMENITEPVYTDPNNDGNIVITMQRVGG